MRKIIMLVVFVLVFVPVIRADNVATITFAGVQESCPPAFNNLTVCTEVWSGTFSIDLTTGALLSSSIFGVGLGGGPWISDAGLFDCEPGVGDCNITWSDAAGLDIEWDPADYESTVLTSSGNDFYTEGIYPTEATSYSITVVDPPNAVPEPALRALLAIGLIGLAVVKRS